MSFISIDSEDDETTSIGNRFTNGVVTVDSDDDVQVFTGEMSSSSSYSSSSDYSSSSEESDWDGEDDAPPAKSTATLSTSPSTRLKDAAQPGPKQKKTKSATKSKFQPINPSLLISQLASSPLQSNSPSNDLIRQSRHLRQTMLLHPQSQSPTQPSSLSPESFTLLRSSLRQSVQTASASTSTSPDPNCFALELYLVDLTLFARLHQHHAAFSFTPPPDPQQHHSITTTLARLVFAAIDQQSHYTRFLAESSNSLSPEQQSRSLTSLLRYQSANCLVSLSTLIYNADSCPELIDIPFSAIATCTKLVKQHSTSVASTDGDDNAEESKVANFVHDYIQRPEILPAFLLHSQPSQPHSHSLLDLTPASASPQGYTLDLPSTLSTHFAAFYRTLYLNHHHIYRASPVTNILSTILWFFSSQPMLYSFSTHHSSRYSEHRSHLASNCLQPVLVKSTQHCTALRAFKQNNSSQSHFPHFVLTPDNLTAAQVNIYDQSSLIFGTTFAIPRLKENHLNSEFSQSQQFLFEQQLLEQFISYAISIPTPAPPSLNKPKLHPLAHSEHLARAAAQLSSQQQVSTTDQTTSNNHDNNNTNAELEQQSQQDTITSSSIDDHYYIQMHSLPVVENTTVLFDQPLLQTSYGTKVTKVPKDHANFIKYYPRNHWLINSLLSHSRQFHHNPCAPQPPSSSSATALSSHPQPTPLVSTSGMDDAYTTMNDDESQPQLQPQPQPQPQLQNIPPDTPLPYPRPELVNPKRTLYSTDQAQLAFSTLDQSTSTTLLHNPFDVDLYSTLSNHHRTAIAQQHSPPSLLNLTLALLFPTPNATLPSTHALITSHLFDFIQDDTIFAAAHRHPLEFWTADGYNLTPLHLLQLIHPMDMYRNFFGSIAHANRKLLNLKATAPKAKAKQLTETPTTTPGDEAVVSDYDKIVAKLGEWQQFRGERAHRWAHRLNVVLELLVFATFTASLQRRLTAKHYSIADQLIGSTTQQFSMEKAAQCCELLEHFAHRDNAFLAPYLKPDNAVHSTISAKLFPISTSLSEEEKSTQISQIIKAIYYQHYYPSQFQLSTTQLFDSIQTIDSTIATFRTSPVIQFISLFFHHHHHHHQQQQTISINNISILRYITNISEFTPEQIPYCISYLLTQLTTSISSLAPTTTTTAASKIANTFAFVIGIATFLTVLLNPLRSSATTPTSPCDQKRTASVNYIHELEQTYSAQFTFLIDSILHLSHIPDLTADNITLLTTTPEKLDLTTILITTLQYWKQHIITAKAAAASTPSTPLQLSFALFASAHLLLFFTLLNVDETSVMDLVLPQLQSTAALFTPSSFTSVPSLTWSPGQSPELTSNRMYNALLHQYYHQYKLYLPTHPVSSHLPTAPAPVSLLAAHMVAPASNITTFTSSSYLSLIIQWIASELTPIASCFNSPVSSSSISTATQPQLAIIASTTHTVATLHHAVILSLSQLVKDHATKAVAQQWITSPTQTVDDIEPSLLAQSLEGALVDIQSTYGTPPGLVKSTTALYAFMTNKTLNNSNHALSPHQLSVSSIDSSIKQFSNSYSGLFAFCSVHINLPSLYAHHLPPALRTNSPHQSTHALFNEILTSSFLAVIPAIFIPKLSPSDFTAQQPFPPPFSTPMDHTPSSPTHSQPPTATASTSVDSNPFSHFLASTRQSMRYYHSNITTPMFELCVEDQSTANRQQQLSPDALSRAFILSLFMSLDELLTPQHVYHVNFVSPTSTFVTRPDDQHSFNSHPAIHFNRDPKISTPLAHTIIASLYHHAIIETPGLCVSQVVPEAQATRKYVPLRPLIQEVDRYITRYHLTSLLLQTVAAIEFAVSIPQALCTNPSTSPKTTAHSITAKFIPSLYFSQLQHQLPHLAAFSNNFLPAQYVIDINQPFKSHWQSHTGIIINSALPAGRKELLNIKQRIKQVEEILSQDSSSPPLRHHIKRRYETELNQLYDQRGKLQKGTGPGDNGVDVTQFAPQKRRQITAVPTEATPDGEVGSVSQVSNRVELIPSKTSHRTVNLSNTTDTDANQLVSLTSQADHSTHHYQKHHHQLQPRGYPISVNFLPTFTADNVTSIVNHQQACYEAADSTSASATTSSAMDDNDSPSATFQPDSMKPIHQQLHDYCMFTISQAFSAYGQVLKVLLPVNPTTNLPRAVCTVFFVAEDAAQQALAAHKFKLKYCFPPVEVSSTIKIEQSQQKYQPDKPPHTQARNAKQSQQYERKDRFADHRGDSYHHHSTNNNHNNKRGLHAAPNTHHQQSSHQQHHHAQFNPRRPHTNPMTEAQGDDYYSSMLAQRQAEAPRQEEQQQQQPQPAQKIVEKTAEEKRKARLAILGIPAKK